MEQKFSKEDLYKGLKAIKEVMASKGVTRFPVGNNKKDFRATSVMESLGKYGLPSDKKWWGEMLVAGLITKGEGYCFYIEADNICTSVVEDLYAGHYAKLIAQQNARQQQSEVKERIVSQPKVKELKDYSIEELVSEVQKRLATSISSGTYSPIMVADQEGFPVKVPYGCSIDIRATHKEGGHTLTDEWHIYTRTINNYFKKD